MQVSQIYLSDSDTSPPEQIRQFVDVTRSKFPKFQHVLYDRKTANEFLIKHCTKEIHDAYETLNPYAYKADLLRYCLLYVFGGWYFDVSLTPLVSVEVPPDIETIAFRDPPLISGTCWGCENGILYAKPNSPVFKCAIDLVLENVKSQYYGINPLCPTGPVVMGRAFALCGDSPFRVFGELMALTPSYGKRNQAYVFPDGTILAFGKPGAGGDLTAFGASGTNNYNELYAKKAVYKTGA